MNTVIYINIHNIAVDGNSWWSLNHCSTVFGLNIYTRSASNQLQLQFKIQIWYCLLCVLISGNNFRAISYEQGHMIETSEIVSACRRQAAAAWNGHREGRCIAAAIRYPSQKLPDHSVYLRASSSRHWFRLTGTALHDNLSFTLRTEICLCADFIHCSPTVFSCHCSVVSDFSDSFL
jgi:hypothetical protein